MFPVEIQFAARPGYLDPRPTWEQAAEAFAGFVNSVGEGDVLIFMPGAFEIRQTIQCLANLRESRGFKLLPLYGELSPREQDAAVAAYNERKVVVATNVAETSLTIEGVRCVIDSGLARIPRYDPYRGINTLLIEKISRASADQRAGRAGRTAPGICLRLWSENEHHHRPAQELPEIKRLDLAEVALSLKAAGVENLRAFRWLEPPDEKALRDAEVLLSDLGALEPLQEQPDAGSQNALARITHHASPGTHHSSRITSLGRKMLAFPVHPRYARLLLAAHDYHCVYQACQLAALTQGRDLLVRNVDADTEQRRRDLVGEKSPGDFWLLLRVWNYARENNFQIEACRRVGIQATAARQTEPLIEQFLEIARREGLRAEKTDVADEAMQKCILLAFSDRVARRLDSHSLRCELVHGRRGTLAKESVTPNSPLLVAAEVSELEGKGKSVQTVLSLTTAIEETWLRELFPNDIVASQRVFYDSTAKRVCAEEQLQFRQLSISSRRIEPPPEDAAAKLLSAEVLAGRLVLEQWDESIEQWIFRLNFLHQHCPELGLAPIGEEERRHLIEQLCHGAYGQKDLKNVAVKSLVQSWLSALQQQQLEDQAPERLRLRNGRSAKITYGNVPPFIALRIQELYDVNTTPRIALGRVPLLVHILAPSRRPVQITQDLASFWRDHYPRIKRELQRKYPKHEWR